MTCVRYGTTQYAGITATAGLLQLPWLRRTTGDIARTARPGNEPSHCRICIYLHATYDFEHTLQVKPDTKFQGLGDVSRGHFRKRRKEWIFLYGSHMRPKGTSIASERRYCSIYSWCTFRRPLPRECVHGWLERLPLCSCRCHLCNPIGSQHRR